MQPLSKCTYNPRNTSRGLGLLPLWPKRSRPLKLLTNIQTIIATTPATKHSDSATIITALLLTKVFDKSTPPFGFRTTCSCITTATIHTHTTTLGCKSVRGNAAVLGPVFMEMVGDSTNPFVKR